MTETTLSKSNIKVIRTCLILRLKELRSRKGADEDKRIGEIENVLEKINET